jgi:hypothetical protein
MATPQEIQNALIGIQNRFRSGDQNRVDWQAATPAMADYVRQNNLNPNDVASAANMLGGGNAWDANKVQQTLSQFPEANYGLTPSLDALSRSRMAANDVLGQTMTGVSGDFSRGIGYLKPYMDAGGSANQVQAALSGALGPQAQQAAYAQYNESPGVQFAAQQGERAITRNASALGGLKGGRVLQELMSFGVGTAQQDFANQFNRLGEVANRGYGASTTGAGMTAQEAAIRSNLGQAQGNNIMAQGAASAGAQERAGTNLSANFGNVSSALANYVNQQGQGVANITGNQASNINSIYQAAAAGDANARSQLATLLQSTNMNAASAQSGVPYTQGGQTNYLGQVAALAGGASGIMQGMNNNQNTGTNYNYSPINNPTTGYGPNYSVPYSPTYQALRNIG